MKTNTIAQNALTKIFLFFVLAGSLNCDLNTYDDLRNEQLGDFPTNEYPVEELFYNYHTHQVDSPIVVKDYFHYMDQLISDYNELTSYELTEYVLLQYNPWIVDRLVNTDYDIQKKDGHTIYDQKELIILDIGDDIHIPNEKAVQNILVNKENTRIDINIPEYKMRIIRNEIILHEIPIRVGRNERKYLETAGRVEDLRTKTGKGYISQIERNPNYINPVNGKIYTSTLRDDKIRTSLPQIPFLYPVINGYMHGQLIHPTTNPNTLGKAYSNGCIGTNEADAWRIYAFAPIGTEIVIRYDLNVTNDQGQEIVLKDIYRD